MDASDMLDIIHVFFEESHSYSSNEHAHRVSRTREVMYESLYEYTYPYAYNEQTGSYNSRGFDLSEEELSQIDEQDSSDDIVPFSPKKRKAYVPPTNVNPDSPKPFGSILDAPLG
jgi:hypothetical protein